MYRAYISIGEFETEQDALDAVAMAEQMGDSTIIKKIEE